MIDHRLVQEMRYLEILLLNSRILPHGQAPLEPAHYSLLTPPLAVLHLRPCCLLSCCLLTCVPLCRSDERVFSLHTMLRAQEQMDHNHTVIFYRDEDGQPGRELDNELLSDLIEIENPYDVPELVVHVRSFIAVLVEPLSNPDCEPLEFFLIGNESIGEIKQMCFEMLGSQDALDDSVELTHCQLHVNGDKFVSDNLSLFEVCITAYENDFNPMVHPIYFALTIDKSESFVLSPQLDVFIVVMICINTVFLSIDHYGSSDTFDSMLTVAEWIFNVFFTLESVLKVYCMKGFISYIRIGQNQFDFLIVASSWINVFVEATGLNLTFVRVFRLMRALRVTRVFRKIESVKKIIDAAFNSLQPIINIMYALSTFNECVIRMRIYAASLC